MNELTRFMKNSFTNRGYFLAALDISFLPPFLMASAFCAFPAIFSSWYSKRRRSGHQFSAQDNVMKNVGGPCEEEQYWW
jgi:hypothetical protein